MKNPDELLQAIREKANSYTKRTKKNPKVIYLGKAEWTQFAILVKVYSEQSYELSSPPQTEASRIEFEGMKVYQVDAETYLSCGE